MNFRFFLPFEEKKSPAKLDYLPTILFSVFARSSNDENNHFLQGVFCRRIPHIMKIKMEIPKIFRSQFALPIGKDREQPYYVNVKKDSYFIQHDFLSNFKQVDYLVTGSLSLDKGEMEIKLYWREENKVVLEKYYKGDKEEFLSFLNDFIKEMFLFFEITSEKILKEAIEEAPVSNYKAFASLMEALDVGIDNNVASTNDLLYEYYLKESLQEDKDSSFVLNLLSERTEKFLLDNKIEEARAVNEFVLSFKPYYGYANILKILILLNEEKVKEAFSLFRQLIKGPKDLVGDSPYKIIRYLMHTEAVELTDGFFSIAYEAGYRSVDFIDSYCYFLSFNHKYKEASNILKNAFEKINVGEITILHLAQLLTLEGSYIEADKFYRDALKLYPSSSRVLVSRAIYYLKMEDFGGARKFINNALEVSPEDPEVNFEGAQLFYFLKEEELAYRYAKTTIELSPRSRIADDARYFLSRVKSKISLKEQKENHYKYIKSLRLLEEGKIKDCIELINEVIKIEPFFRDAWFIKGVACRKKGDVEEAIKAFDEVGSLFKDQVVLNHEYARCYMSIGDFARAFPYMLYAFKKNPQDPVIMANMGIIYMYLGRLQEAESLLYQSRRMGTKIPMLDKYIKQLELIKKKKKSSGGNGGIYSN